MGIINSMRLEEKRDGCSAERSREMGETGLAEVHENLVSGCHGSWDRWKAGRMRRACCEWCDDGFLGFCAKVSIHPGI